MTDAISSVEAWQRIMRLNSLIRGCIKSVHRAQHDLGLPMSPRARACVETMYRQGLRWRDLTPELTKTNAGKAILHFRSELPAAWAAYREAVAHERKANV